MSQVQSPQQQWRASCPDEACYKWVSSSFSTKTQLKIKRKMLQAERPEITQNFPAPVLPISLNLAVNLFSRWTTFSEARPQFFPAAVIFPTWGQTDKNELGFEFLILEQSIISVTEKAQAGVNDEHAHVRTQPWLKKHVHQTQAHISHMLEGKPLP